MKTKHTKQYSFMKLLNNYYNVTIKYLWFYKWIWTGYRNQSSTNGILDIIKSVVWSSKINKPILYSCKQKAYLFTQILVDYRITTLNQYIINSVD